MPDMYSKAAEKYRPDKIKVLFIAESPPYMKKDTEPRYFYFEHVAGKDFLFKNIMQVLFPDDYEQYRNDKAKLLKIFKENGFFLIDACEYPINQYKKRNEFIKNEYPNLVRRIRKIINEKTKIVLIKKNVYQLLFDSLKKDGFNVINQKHLNFPSCGNQKKFREKLSALLNPNGVV
jgi:hypothetical protein